MPLWYPSNRAEALESRPWRNIFAILKYSLAQVKGESLDRKHRFQGQVCYPHFIEIPYQTAKKLAKLCREKTFRWLRDKKTDPIFVRIFVKNEKENGGG